MCPNIFGSLPSYIPPRRYCSALLHTIDWLDFGFLGPYRFEPNGPRCHVLVLLPERTRHQNLVEGVDHPSSNHSIRYRSW